MLGHHVVYFINTSPGYKISAMREVYHALKPSHLCCGNHAPCQYKECDFDIKEHGSKNCCNYIKVTFICFLANPN